MQKAIKVSERAHKYLNDRKAESGVSVAQFVDDLLFGKGSPQKPPEDVLTKSGGELIHKRLDDMADAFSDLRGELLLLTDEVESLKTPPVDSEVVPLDDGFPDTSGNIDPNFDSDERPF